jgi:tetratricopeptide (TPR) repeat protein
VKAVSRRLFLAACFFVLVCPGAPLLPAQVSGSGPGGGFSITGRVLSEPGNQPIELAQVSLRTFTGMTMQQVGTDNLGNFAFHNLGRGVYYVHVWKRGYGEQNERVELVSFSQIGMIISLTPARDKPAPERSQVVPAALLKLSEKSRKEFQAGLEEFLRKGNLDQALLHFTRLSQQDPGFAPAYYWSAMVLLDLNRADEALDSLRRSIELDEKIAPAYFPLASIHMQRKEYRIALQILEKGLELSPNSWQGHYERARACLAIENLACAEASALKSRELHQGFPKLHLLLANVFLLQDKIDQAIAEAEAYLSVADDPVMAEQVRQQLAELKRRPPGF